MDSIITFQNIKKQFGKTTVLKGIDLEIKGGEIFGLLGVNGAGKTTLMRSLMHLLHPEAGTLSFKGKPLTSAHIQKHFGFLPENFVPPGNLTAEEFLNLLSWGLGVPAENVGRLLGLVELQRHKSKPIRTYSRGMIQRLGLCCALVKDPQVVVLDEPTLGLDPVGQKQVLDILGKLNAEGKTVFFSSHILSQIARVCTRVGVLHTGIISFRGTVYEILEKHKASFLEEAFLKEIGA